MLPGEGLADVFNRHVRKRDQSLTTGEYLAIAALNRAMQVRSKALDVAMVRCHDPVASLAQSQAANLSSQRFWDHMDRIAAPKPRASGKSFCKASSLVKASICHASATMAPISTLHRHLQTRAAHRPPRQEQQGRNNLRQVSYALFCCARRAVAVYSRSTRATAMTPSSSP